MNFIRASTKTELARSHRKDARYENGKGNILLETHLKKANRKTKDTLGDVRKDIHHHHHHVQEGLGLIPVPCVLKMKLVPPSLPRSSYVSSSIWFIL